MSIRQKLERNRLVMAKGRGAREGVAGSSSGKRIPCSSSHSANKLVEKLERTINACHNMGVVNETC